MIRVYVGWIAFFLLNFFSGWFLIKENPLKENHRVIAVKMQRCIKAAEVKYEDNIDDLKTAQQACFGDKQVSQKTIKEARNFPTGKVVWENKLILAAVGTYLAILALILLFFRGSTTGWGETAANALRIIILLCLVIAAVGLGAHYITLRLA